MERGDDTATVVMTTGAMIRFFRSQQGLSIVALAARAHISPTHLQRIEQGQGNVTLVKLIRIARALGVMLADLSPSNQAGEVGPEELHVLMSQMPRPVFQAICHLLMLCRHDSET